MIAKDQMYLGGPGAHPFGYKHRFFDVVSYRPLTDAQAKKREKRGDLVVYLSGRPFGVYRGGDAKKALAFEPQSIAAGVLRRILSRLFDPEETPSDGKSYLGEITNGKTALRAPIHDAGFCEVPVGELDFALEAMTREFLRPVEELKLPLEWGLGKYLNFGVKIQVGHESWQKMETVAMVRGGGVDDRGGLTLPTGEHVGVAWDMRAEMDDEELVDFAVGVDVEKALSA